MADSASQVTSKTVEKNRVQNTVNRTTSETLRVADSERQITTPSSLAGFQGGPKKKTSFQITSVVSSRTSNDGGDDSADDLDESHTDDISEVIDVSRDIENETPSYSEDTFSKDDVFFNASASLGSAPVIPTSAQYGLAILATPENCEALLNSTDNCGNSVTGAEIHVTVPDNVINLGVVSTKPDPEMRDIHTHTTRHERFKVVKIESTEPFRRGRWVCMDYLDHTMSNTKNVKEETKSGESNDNSPLSHPPAESGAGTGDLTVSNTLVSPASEEVTAIEAMMMAPMQESHQSQPQNNPHPPQTCITPNYTSVSPGQSLQTNIQMVTAGINTNQPQPQQAQSLSQVTIQQSMPPTNQHQSLQPQQIQQVIQQANMMPVQQQQQQQPQPPQPANLVQQHYQQQTQFQPIQPQVMHQQQMSVPQMIPMAQPINVPQSQGQSIAQQIPLQQQQQPQQAPHQVTYSQTLSQPSSQPQSMTGIVTQMTPQQMQSFQPNQMMQPQPNMMPQHVQVPQYYTLPQASIIQTMPSQMSPQPQVSMPPMSQGSPLPVHSGAGTTHIHMQTYPVSTIQQPQPISMAQTTQMGPGNSYSVQFPPTSHIPTQTNQQIVHTMPATMIQQPQPQPQPQQQQQQLPPQTYVNMTTPGQSYAQSVTSTVPSSDPVSVTPSSDVSTVDSSLVAPAPLESLADLAAPLSEEAQQGEDSESASGASTVAIDNKIEQAMDLVKSHLMFAVREEVEVLKEKITELMERINQLEIENSILRANASQETLAQLPPTTTPNPPVLSANPS